MLFLIGEGMGIVSGGDWLGTQTNIKVENNSVVV